MASFFLNTHAKHFRKINMCYYTFETLLYGSFKSPMIYHTSIQYVYNPVRFLSKAC